MTEEVGAHVAPQPFLKCNRSRDVQYLNGALGNFDAYVRTAQRPEGSGMCALLEPRYLVPPQGKRRLFRNP